jgi:hypothetical protein
MTLLPGLKSPELGKSDIENLKMRREQQVVDWPDNYHAGWPMLGFRIVIWTAVIVIP